MLVYMVQHVGDWAAPIPRVSIPLLLPSNSSMLPLHVPQLPPPLTCTRVGGNHHHHHHAILDEKISSLDEIGLRQSGHCYHDKALGTNYNFVSMQPNIHKLYIYINKYV